MTPAPNLYVESVKFVSRPLVLIPRDSGIYIHRGNGPSRERLDFAPDPAHLWDFAHAAWAEDLAAHEARRESYRTPEAYGLDLDFSL